MNDYKMFINGQWVDATDGKTFVDYNPYTGDIIARIAAGNRTDARLAVEAAAAAFPAWSKALPTERRMYLLKAADALERRQDDFLRIMAQESGSTFGISIYQFIDAVNHFREAAGQVTYVNGEILPTNFPGVFSMLVRQPLGVVVHISPWNAPLILSIRSIVFPIAYGNTMVLKPSMETPISGALLIAEIFDEIKLPAGVFNVVTNGPGGSGEVGNEFIQNDQVRHISLTGSTAVGKQIAEKAARHLKKISLELGGSDPFIVLKDADIDYAVDAAVFGRFLHQGQICMSSKRFIVEKPVVKEFTEKLVNRAKKLKVGDPCEQDTIIGPLINQGQLNIIKTQVDDAVKKGAKVLCGGTNNNLCYNPTVLSNVTARMKVFSEEVFGPVAPVMQVADTEQAISVANDSVFGLSAAVITRDFQKGLEIAEQLEAGMVHINDSSVCSEAQAPFGGIKQSGYGKIGGKAAIEEYTTQKWITIQRTPKDFPF
jgi:acyl-CoA reductase-like NAD-dependent aldehyde dehydrogenase